MTYPFDLRIICHAYARRLPLYASMLRFQLASMIHYPPQRKVLLSIFGAGHDGGVRNVLRDFHHADAAPFTVEFNVMPESMLFRRAIARHEASQQDAAAVLYFADADYCFGPGCLDAMAALGPQAPFCMPRVVYRNHSHEAGAEQLQQQSDGPWPVVDPRLYFASEEKLAIGGIQIIGAELAKQVGYLGGTKWTQPADPSKGFSSFRDDSIWRKSAGLAPAKRVDIPHLYRIRHSLAGHNVSPQPEGTNNGSGIENRKS